VIRYLDTDLDIACVAPFLEACPVWGLDTEFYGLDVRKVSTAHRSDIHLLSVAIPRPGGRFLPHGYPELDSYVFSRAAVLRSQWLRGALSDSGVTKLVHNLPVDAHTLSNAGLEMHGAVNTLTLLRFYEPWRNPAEGGTGFHLDALGVELGMGKPTSFRELVENTQQVVKFRNVKECSCGKGKCRKQGPGHERTTKSVASGVKAVKSEFPLESIVPGHERWPLLLRYSATDAEMVLALYCRLVSRYGRGLA
jgi:hypothetical protein